MGAQWKRAEPDYAGIRADAIAEMIELGFSDEAAAAEARRREERARARCAYAHGLIDRLMAANEAVTQAWFRFLDAHPEYCEGGEKEDEECGFEPEEQKEVDAILAEIDAIKDHDRWPRHLHFGGV